MADIKSNVWWNSFAHLPREPQFSPPECKNAGDKGVQYNKRKKSDPALFGTHETSVTAERIIIT